MIKIKIQGKKKDVANLVIINMYFSFIDKY